MADPAAAGLVHVSTYQWVSKDTTTPSAQVEQALDDALRDVQDHLARKLPLATYTETLRVYRDGKVYPAASPIQSVTSPNVAALSIQGAGLFLGYFDPVPVISFSDWSGAVPPQVTVTYTGGYTIDGAAGSTILPVRLRDALCRVAFNRLHPASLPSLPAGATSVHVGDVGYSGQQLRTFDPLDDGIRRDLRGYRHPSVLGWQT